MRSKRPLVIAAALAFSLVAHSTTGVLVGAPTSQRRRTQGSVPAAVASQDLSSIQIPITVSLESAFQRAEEIIPQVIDQSADYIEVKKDALGALLAKYKVWRDPLKLSIDGNRVNLSVHAYYWIEVAQKIVKPAPLKGEIIRKLGSCGIGESPREVNLGFDIQIDWRPDWGLQSTTTLRDATFPNECRMTFLSLDQTDRIRQQLYARVKKAATSIDERIQSFDVRSRIEQAWQWIQRPVVVGAGGGWLRIVPLGAKGSPLLGSGNSITTTIGISARASYVIGSPPPSPEAVQYLPLPLLERGQPGQSGIHVVLDAIVPFQSASEQLARLLVGKEYQFGENKVEIVAVSASGRGDVALLKAEFAGWLKGTAYFQGKLVFDPASGKLAMQGLDVKVDSHDQFTKDITDAFLKNPSIKAKIADAASWPVSDQVADAKAQLTRLLNRQLAPNAYLGGEVTDIALDRVTAIPADLASRDDVKDAFRIRLILNAHASLDLK